MSMVMSRRVRFGAVAVLAMAVMAGPALAQIQETCPADIPQGRALQSLRGAWDANDAIGLAQSTIDSARVSLEPSGDRLPVSYDTVADSLNRARNTCVSAQTPRRGRANLAAYSCAAQAEDLMARYNTRATTGDRDASYASAACRFNVVAAKASDASRQATAYENRARAFEGRRALGGASANDHLTQAIAAYDAAIRAGDTPARRLARARALGAGGRDSDANTAYVELFRSASVGTLPAIERSNARMDQAVIQERLNAQAQAQGQQLPFPTSGILALWREARSLNTTARTVVELGIRYFNQGNHLDAGREFEAGLVAPNDNPTGAGTNYRNEANYYLSVLAANNSNWPVALSRANDAGTADFRYRRQQCLAYIALGGQEEFRSAAESSQCTRDENAEGLLLKGMYYLRRAQYVPNIGLPRNRRTWDGYITNASNAFRSGRNLALRLTGPDAALSWPGQQAQLVDVLDFGESVVAAVGRACAVEPQGGNAAARQIFGRYRVLGCQP